MVGGRRKRLRKTREVLSIGAARDLHDALSTNDFLHREGKGSREQQLVRVTVVCFVYLVFSTFLNQYI